ncbi:MAG: Peptidoglycan-binding domain 1 protein [Patescibacteria group bacterium]|jgi:hypothetical protein|nr:Peptidoglycan-binding domain 1 protein [Patescibacteria group bacterium]
MEVDQNVGCPAGKKPIGGRVYDIKLLEEYNKEVDLLKPATVTMYYEEGELSGVDESSISMYHFDDSSGWSKLTSCVLDKENNSLTCQTESFSKFILSADVFCKKLSKKLMLGSHHKEVSYLKKYLNQIGFLQNYKGLENNFFDFKTRNALKDFQEVSGIVGNEARFGILGKKTRNYINSQSEE